MPNVKKRAIFALLLFLLGSLILFTSGTIFASSDNLVEQNIESIPEFPSVMVLPLTLTETAAAVVLMRRCR